MTLKPKPSCRRYTGIAMILVMITVAMATITSISFMQSQRASTGIALNVRRQVMAKMAAESAMDFAIEYLRTDASWRTSHNHGAWMTDTTFNQSIVNLSVEDETDTDLSDDKQDSIMITCTADVQGVTYSIRTRMVPYTKYWGNRTVSHWKLDETDPAQGVRDSAGTNHGVYVNFDASRMNQPGHDASTTAIYMDGGMDINNDPPSPSNSYFYIPDGPYKDLPEGSLSIWFKSDAEFDGGIITRYQCIFSCKAFDNDPIEGEMYVMFWGQPLEITTDGCNVPGAMEYVEYLNDHDWHHLILSWDTATIRIYLDGQIKWAWASSCGLSNNEIMAFGILTRKMNSGDIYPWGEEKHFHGYMSDITLYNYPIDDEQVGAVYNGVDQPPFEIFYDVR